MNLFFLLLLSHILGDWVLNSSRLARLKRRPAAVFQALAIGCHASVHAVSAGLILFVVHGSWLKGALLGLGAHFLIDWARCRVEGRILGPQGMVLSRSQALAWIRGRGGNLPHLPKKDFRPWLWVNLGDQGAHLVSLYWIAQLIA